MPMDTVYASGKVAVDFLNLRRTPGGDVVKVLPKFTRVDILARTGDWLQVVTEGKPGYVAVQYIKLMSDQEVPKQTKKTGKVSASRLNLRASPSGEILQVIPKDSVVEIIDQTDDWLKVTINDLVGYVSKKYINENNTKNRQSEGRFYFQDKAAIATDGTKFGTKHKKGIFNYGETSIKDYIESNQSRFPVKLKSSLNVMIAASENEGKYEAINTWDNSFLSFGIFQWTCGATTAAGELPALLDRLQKTYPETYQEYFAQYGLSIAKITNRKGVAMRGYFDLNGVLLNNKDNKNKLRTLAWAYRFWSAGFDNNVREIETLHAIDRIAVFYQQDNRKIGNFYIADYVSSEYGVALLLDQHVNRPGHVPKILAQAVESLKNQLPIDNPQSWGDTEEAVLIDKYLQLRSVTSMTHSQKRAETIRIKVAQGLISKKRNSFKLAS